MAWSGVGLGGWRGGEVVGMNWEVGRKGKLWLGCKNKKE